MYQKLGRNDLCWCGSGRKYKRCHLGREAEPPLPIEAIVAQMRKGGDYRTCLHPDASRNTCGKVISAHTLQRSRVLQGIVDNENHVLTFHPVEPESDGRLKVHKRGWKQASTFDAFCDQHDSTAFAPLETMPFSGTKEQVFLIAYRSICWELYQKIRAIKSGSARRDLIDRGMPTHFQRRTQTLLQSQDAGFHKGMDDLYSIKQLMDRALSVGDFSSFITHEFRLDGPLGIAATGAITPNTTLSGVQLQTLHDPLAKIEWLTFGVDVSQSSVSVVFLWFDNHAAPLRYIDEVASLDEKQIPEFLLQFFFAYCENTYFAAKWWYSLSEMDRALLERLMANSNPYYCQPEYDLSRSIAPWKLELQRRL